MRRRKIARTAENRSLVPAFAASIPVRRYDAPWPNNPPQPFHPTAPTSLKSVRQETGRCRRHPKRGLRLAFVPW